ncbi:thioredoxin [Cytophagaceae bacterium BD1B2-1]|uniref:Thioredoxin n=2 Tax=Xanthocytophaga agilis TaxID=3048010 RepID=A0AAE3UHZ1_9BACT|nr:thioredoxin [Xanthocytophaga agilis]
MKNCMSFQEIINAETPVLVDFYATWCGPCKVQAPILEDLSKRVGDQARILKIDVDKNPAVADKYGIQGVPTLMIFKNGKVVWRQSGVMQSNQLQKVLQQYI